MFILEQSIRPHADVVDTELEDRETVLLHLDDKLYFSLNSTGTRIWHGLKQGLTLGEISRRLQEEFDVAAAIADQSVLTLLEELHEHRLVQATDPE